MSAVLSTRLKRGALGCLLAIPLLLIACGGGDGPSSEKVDVEDWVDDLCAAGVDFTEASDATFEDLVEIDLTEDGAKDDIVKVFEAQKDALDDFEAEVNEIGTPDIDGGSDVMKAVSANFDARQKYLDDFIKMVKGVDEGRDFEDDLNEGAEDIDEPDTFLDRLEDIDEPDVEDLIDLLGENPDCAFALE